jgi:spore photoproduct lyase
MVLQLFVDEAVIALPWVQKIQQRFPNITPVVVSGFAHVQAMVAEKKDPVSEGKQVLFLTANRGSFFKKCPGTKSYLCCGYQILHIGTYCTMDCSYCILQAYFAPPVLQGFVNLDDMFDEINRLTTTPCVPFHRIGTGEFTDSLLWEPWTDLSAELVPRFAQQDRAVLELKTKTCNVKNLKGLDHNRKTIVAWSLNAIPVIQREEKGTARLEARLDAAARCEAWGYPLAFHFDPLFFYEGWEKDYEEVVRRLFKAVSPKSVVWISLGSFRFMPSLKPIIQSRFPESKIVYGEFVRGLDGKMRYFKPLRIALYRNMVRWIRRWAPDVAIYLCMEDEEVWDKSLGFIPEREGGLSDLLDRAAEEHCGIKI